MTFLIEKLATMRNYMPKKKEKQCGYEYITLFNFKHQA